MAGTLTALGIASQAGEQRLAATFVWVRLPGPEAQLLAPWRGARGTHAGRQLAQLVDVIRNRVEEATADAVALKRIESPRGRPPSTYDDRIRLEGAVMLAAVEADLPYYAFRKQTLKSRLEGDDPYVAAALACSSLEMQGGQREALAAAYAALGDLGQRPR